jgi:hypothetical protein
MKLVAVAKGRCLSGSTELRGAARAERVAVWALWVILSVQKQPATESAW